MKAGSVNKLGWKIGAFVSGAFAAISAAAPTPGLWIVPNSSTIRVGFTRISSDGSTAVGGINRTDQTYPNQFSPVRWTREHGVEVIPGTTGWSSTALTSNHDGSIIAGSASIPGIPNGGWTQTIGNNAKLLPLIPGSFQGTVTALSDDGKTSLQTIRIGTESSYVNHAVIHTEGTEPIDLGTLGFGTTRPWALSGDGRTAVGTVGGDAAGFVWRQATGMQFAPEPTTTSVSAPTTVNRDGTFIAGDTFISGNPSGGGLVIWNRDLFPTIIGRPSWARTLSARAISDDGTVVAMIDNSDPSIPGGSAFVWSASNGFMTLNSYVSMLGIPVPSGFYFRELWDMSSDGLTFVGIVENPTIGYRSSFVVTVPSPGVLAMGVCGVLVTSARRRRRA
jgi:hypothetical protein